VAGLPLPERSIGDYVTSVSSAAPVPGGGSVAGVGGALAAALIEMVANLTLAGRHSPEAEGPLREAARGAEEMRARLLDLAERDERAYAGYRAAIALPNATDEERSARADAKEAALAAAGDVPLRCADACRAVIELAALLAAHGTRHALSDVSTAVLLAGAAGESALLNVRVNAGLMRDAERASSMLSRASSLSAGIRTAELLAQHALAARGR
jgi:formiminotetrahydrofolate cyclodeaminase